MAAILALAFLGLATQQVVRVLSQEAQRAREAELLFVGQAWVHAIASYLEASPGAVKTFPRELEDLVEDRRHLTMKRHLRAPYADPVSRLPMQPLRRADGTIEGVRSPSEATPIRSGAIQLDTLRLAAASRYAGWHFVHVPHASGEHR